MALIPCLLDCKYQKDGECNLNKIAVVNSVNNKCPYYIKNTDSKEAVRIKKK